MPKNINVSITTVDAELQFSIQSSTMGKHLFEQIIKTIGLRETWYFGLLYTDAKGNYCWLDLEKKVLNINVINKNNMEFQFLVKFYPEDVAEELIQEITIKLFYLQTRESILRNETFCPADTAVLLSSYACQVKFGDYNPNLHKPGFLSTERILPNRILSQYNWSITQWENKIVKWYSEHQGMFRDEAMLEYMKIAQDLEMYGVSYFEIKNKKGSLLYLGVDALGLNIYKSGDKLTPQVGFPWGEIRNISFKDKRFIIKSIDKKSPDFVFYVNKLRVNKNILALCAGNHELFVRRRNEDSIDVQQMKAQAKEQRVLRVNERDRLVTEKSAREAAEKRLHSIERKLEKETQEHAITNESLMLFRESVDLMREKLEEENRQKIELEKRQQELSGDQKSLQDLDIYTNLEKDNNQKCDHSLIEKLEKNVSENEDIVIRRKRDMKAKSENIATPVNETDLSDQPKIYKNVFSVNLDKTVKAYKHDLTVLENGDSEMSLANRQTLIESDHFLHLEMKTLEKELKDARNSVNFDEVDHIYEKNKSKGLDKFKTLRQIRQGNTKKRIDEFESM